VIPQCFKVVFGSGKYTPMTTELPIEQRWKYNVEQCKMYRDQLLLHDDYMRWLATSRAQVQTHYLEGTKDRKILEPNIENLAPGTSVDITNARSLMVKLANFSDLPDEIRSKCHEAASLSLEYEAADGESKPE